MSTDRSTPRTRPLPDTREAQELFVSEATVRTHQVRVYGKLGVTDRAAAVVTAYRPGILA